MTLRERSPFHLVRVENEHSASSMSSNDEVAFLLNEATSVILYVPER